MLIFSFRLAWQQDPSLRLDLSNLFNDLENLNTGHPYKEVPSSKDKSSQT